MNKYDNDDGKSRKIYVTVVARDPERFMMMLEKRREVKKRKSARRWDRFVEAIKKLAEKCRE